MKLAVGMRGESKAKRVSCASRRLCYSLREAKGASMRVISEESMAQAVEITKAAVTPVGTGCHHIGNQDNVAKFLETIARKLEELRNGPEPR